MSRMRIPIMPPNRFIFNGYYYKDKELITIAVVERSHKGKQVNNLGLYMIPAYKNHFNQDCPYIFLHGEIDIGMSGLGYLMADVISADAKVAEDFINEHGIDLNDIPEELIIQMLNI